MLRYACSSDESDDEVSDEGCETMSWAAAWAAARSASPLDARGGVGPLASSEPAAVVGGNSEGGGSARSVGAGAGEDGRE